MFNLNKTSGFLFAIGAILIGIIAEPAHASEHVKVGVTPGDGEIIWEQVKVAAAKEGINIQLVVFSDYAGPNTALADGDLDLNAFQHRQFLANQNKIRGYAIEPIGDTVVAPIGLYSARYKNLADLPDEAQIAIPNDPSNGGRALLLLQSHSLIKLKAGVGTTPSVADILDNPHKFKLTEIDAAQLPRSLQDVAAAVINTNYALPAGLNPRRDALAQESSENNPYANVIAARAKDKDNPLYRKIVSIYQQPALKAFILERFEGALIPAW
jgi:D-methionine transport system substrate-binding protein